MKRGQKLAARNGLSPFNHIPVPDQFKTKLREQTFYRLGQKALLKAEEIKGERLTKQEVDEVLGKLRAELERRGFFSEK